MSVSDAFYEQMKEDMNKKIKQLRKALKEYGWHLYICPSSDHICAPCDCGFEQILKEEEDEG